MFLNLYHSIFKICITLSTEVSVSDGQQEGKASFEPQSTRKVKHFGQRLLSELVKPPWMNKKIESVSEALAFVKVSELIGPFHL